MFVWMRVNLTDFTVEQEGFSGTSGDFGQLYVTTGSDPLPHISELRHAEYAQAVEVDAKKRRVRFGRDYLGHYPLLYGHSERYLYLSDDLSWIKKALEQDGFGITVNEEALGFYFCTGYIPQGLSAYAQITTCEAATLYQWCAGRISKTSLFQPVEVDPSWTVTDLDASIEEQAVRFARGQPEIDVWCSGGLDSSIMAHCFNSNGRRAELLTLGYGDAIHDQYGDGERSYALEVAFACNTNIRDIAYDERKFEATHRLFINTHHSPVVDTCVTPKYALAEASRSFVVTGEGGDNLFGGPKNNQMLYVQHECPSLPVGRLYVLAHNRFASRLSEILVRGESLLDHVSDYYEKWMAFFPGELIRKLFYMNITLKAAGMIFPQSYYASRRYGISARHPIASLGVYRAAFRLADEHKYRYPRNKLCLLELYRNRLPRSIIERRKSGTMLPLRHYLNSLPAERFSYDYLHATGFFVPEFLERMGTPQAIEADPLLVYGLMTLNMWFNQKGETSDVEHLSAESRSYEQSYARVGLQ